MRGSASSVVLVLALPAFLLAPGCGLLFQTVGGWSNQETRRETVAVTVGIVAPPGAEVIRRAPAGDATSLGLHAAGDRVSYVEEVTTEKPSFGWLLLGTAVDAVVSGVLIAQNGSDQKVYGTEGMVLIVIPELITALAWGLSGSSIKARHTLNDTDLYGYTARRGEQTIAAAQIHIAQGAHVLLLPKGDKDTVETPLGTFVSKTPVEARAEPVSAEEAPSPEPHAAERLPLPYPVRVQEAEDLSAIAHAPAIDAALVKAVASALRLSLLNQGIKVDNDSAPYLIVPRISHYRDRCLLNAELIRLEAQTIAAAASAAGECAPSGIADMADHVARALASIPRD